MKKARTSSPGRFLIGALIVFFAAAFSRPGLLKEQDARLYVLAAAVAVVLLVCGSKHVARMLGQDRILLVISLALCGLSILVAALADIGSAQAQAFRCAGSLILMIAGSLVIRTVRSSALPALFPAVSALILLVLHWLPGIGFRLVPVAVVLLMLAFNILLSSRKQLAAMLLALAGLILLLAQNAPVPAAVWAITFLLLFWAYAGHPAVLFAGAIAAAVSGYVANRLHPGMFTPAGTASVFMEVSPGWLGLGLSDSFFAETVFSDMSPFSWIVFRFGWVFAACVLMFYPVIIMRGSALARASGNRLHGLMAMGSVLLVALSAIAALLSDFGLWTGSDFSMPGLTCDLPSLAAFLFLMGLCGGVSVRNQSDLREDAHIAMLSA